MLLRALTLWVVLSALVAAQEYRALISGQVVDPSASAVPNATVTATNVDTNVNITTSTGADGHYVLAQVPLGRYTVTGEAAGFRKFTRAGLSVNVGDKVTVNIRLEVGDVTESVTVTAELLATETNRSVLGQLMDNKGVSELPLNGRQVFMLMQLLAGVIFTQQVFGATGFSGTRAWDVNGQWTIHGGLTNSNAFLVDGASINAGSGAWRFAPLVDGVEEFKVTAPSADASLGLSGGGVINMTMKSGGNTFHGTISEYLRNHIFDAVATQTNRAAAQRPDLRNQQHQWNDFSGLVTGPIQKDKFFFSAWYEGFRERVPFPVTRTFPTLLERVGDFSQSQNASGQLYVIYDPLTTQQAGNRFVRQAFQNNRLPAGRIHPISTNILKHIPSPNIVTDPVTQRNNFAASPNVGIYGYDAWYSKFDYVWSSNHRTTASVTENWGNEYRRTNGVPSGPAVQGNAADRRNHYASTLDHVWTVNATTVVNLRAAWERFVQDNRRVDNERFDGSSLGWKAPIGSAPTIHFPVLSFSDYTGVGASGRTFNPDNVYALTADVSKILGKHFLKFGTRVAERRSNRLGTGDEYGNFSFTRGFTQRDPQFGDADSGHAIASFMAGYPSGGSTVVNPHSSWNTRSYALYIQDDFKLSPRLTLNLGLRWDLQTPVVEWHNRMVAGFDPDVTYRLANGQAKGGFVFARPERRQAWSANYRDFQPRLGVSYQIRPKLVMRASYGMSVLPLGGSGGNTAVRQNGYSRTTPYVATIGGGINSYIPNRPAASTWDLPYPNGILQPFGSSLGPKTQVGQGITYDEPTYIVPRVHQFNIGFEYELPWRVTLEGSYVGSRTRRLPHSQDIDSISLEERLKGFADPNYLNASAPNPFAGAEELVGTGLGAATVTRNQFLRPLNQFTGVTRANLSIGSQSGDLLETRANKRFSGGLMFIGAYTFAKLYHTRGFREPQYNYIYRTIIDYDRPHHLAFTFQYDLPFGTGKRFASGASTALDKIIGGWQFNTSLEYMMGTPTGKPDAHNLRNPELPQGQQTFDKWFDTCTLLTNGRRQNCSSPEAPVTWVQLRPNELRTFDDRFPNIRNHWATQVNLSLFKNIRFRERYNLQLRAEAFNAFNTPIYGGPSTGLTSPTFGLVVLDQNNFPRSMQFAFRLSF